MAQGVPKQKCSLMLDTTSLKELIIRTSKIIFSKKFCPSICLSVCLVCPVCPVPSRPPKKVAETENFAKQSGQIYFKGDKKLLIYAAVLGEAKLSYVYSILKPHFRVSSPPQSWSQAVVCVSTPRKYPRSGYFLV